MNGVNWDLGDKRVLISHMETRSNWKQIVESVPCPTCGSEQCAPCRNLSALPGTVFAQSPRTDWHSERKYVAAKAWTEFTAKPDEAVLAKTTEEPEEEAE